VKVKVYGKVTVRLAPLLISVVNGLFVHLDALAALSPREDSKYILTRCLCYLTAGMDAVGRRLIYFS
jgi:hypothetical protein